MSSNMGFSWGFQPEIQTKPKDHSQNDNQFLFDRKPNANSSMVMKQRPKRRIDSSSPSTSNEEIFLSNDNQSPAPRKYSTIKKKTQLLNLIKGQSLPISRGIELMDKEQLQSILLDLMNNHPEIQQTVHNKLQQTNFSNIKYMELLKSKLNQIYANVPYSRSFQNENLNDYAFVRMKPYILEFLNCLVDCILDNIPPRIENLHDSLKFLDVCTEMVTQLPRFELASNNYYYDKCLEQLSYVWSTVVEHVARDLVILFNDESLLTDWVRKLEYHNERSQGILERPLQLFRSLSLNLGNLATSETLNSSQHGAGDANATSRNTITYE